MRAQRDQAVKLDKSSWWCETAEDFSARFSWGPQSWSCVAWFRVAWEHKWSGWNKTSRRNSGSLCGDETSHLFLAHRELLCLLNFCSRIVLDKNRVFQEMS